MPVPSIDAGWDLVTPLHADALLDDDDKVNLIRLLDLSGDLLQQNDQSTILSLVLDLRA